MGGTRHAAAATDALRQDAEGIAGLGEDAAGLVDDDVAAIPALPPLPPTLMSSATRPESPAPAPAMPPPPPIDCAATPSAWILCVTTVPEFVTVTAPPSPDDPPFPPKPPPTSMPRDSGIFSVSPDAAEPMPPPPPMLSA